MTHTIAVDLVRHLTTHDAARVVDLERAGFSRSTVHRYLRSGLLTTHARGVVSLAEHPDQHRARSAAALLAVDGSVLSHQTAAQLLGIEVDDGQVHLSAPAGSPPRGGQFVLHRVTDLSADQLRTIDGLACTSLVRTLHDLAATTSSDEHYEWILERQVVAERVTLAALQADFGGRARRGRRGAARRNRALAALTDRDPVVADSALEEAFARLLASAGVEGVAFHFRPPWFDGVRGVVDAAIPSARLVIELDGRRWHSTRADFQRDRDRDRRAAEHGWRVLRFTHGDVMRRPQAVIDSILAALACSPPSW